MKFDLVEVKHNCKLKEKNSDFCIYVCAFNSSENLRGRVTVCHSAWASIFEKEFYLKSNENCVIEIQLPRRNYNWWWLRAGFWSDDKYGILEDWLPC